MPKKPYTNPFNRNPLGLTSTASFVRNPHKHLPVNIVWRVEDQTLAIRFGFWIGRRKETVGRGGPGYTRINAHRTQVHGVGMNDDEALTLIAQGEFQGRPFFERCAAFIRQQETHGWVGSWETNALNPRGQRMRTALMWARIDRQDKADRMEMAARRRTIRKLAILE